MRQRGREGEWERESAPARTAAPAPRVCIPRATLARAAPPVQVPHRLPYVEGPHDTITHRHVHRRCSDAQTGRRGEGRDRSDWKEDIYLGREDWGRCASAEEGGGAGGGGGSRGRRPSSLGPDQ